MNCIAGHATKEQKGANHPPQPTRTDTAFTRKRMKKEIKTNVTVKIHGRSTRKRGKAVRRIARSIVRVLKEKRQLVRKSEDNPPRAAQSRAQGQTGGTDKAREGDTKRGKNSGEHQSPEGERPSTSGERSAWVRPQIDRMLRVDKARNQEWKK